MVVLVPGTAECSQAMGGEQRWWWRGRSAPGDGAARRWVHGRVSRAPRGFSLPRQSVLQTGLGVPLGAVPATLMPADSSGFAGSCAFIYLQLQASSPSRGQNAITRKPGGTRAARVLGIPAAALRHAESFASASGRCRRAPVPVPGTWAGNLSSLGGSWFNVPGPGSHAGVSDVASPAAPSVPNLAGKWLLYLGTGRCRGWQGCGAGGGGGCAGTDPPPVCLAQVNVTVDYIRPASSATETVPAFSERTCATVSIGGM